MIVPDKKTHSVTNKMAKQMVELRDAGWKLEAISMHLGVSKPCVQWHTDPDYRERHKQRALNRYHKKAAERSSKMFDKVPEVRGAPVNRHAKTIREVYRRLKMGEEIPGLMIEQLAYVYRHINDLGTKNAEAHR